MGYRIEADSLEDVRKKLAARVDLIVLQESNFSREKTGTIEGVAHTVEEAFVKAKSGIPAEAKIEKE